MSEPDFREALLAEILQSGEAGVDTLDAADRRRRLAYVGRAIAGAAALALGGLLGWRRARGRPEREQEAA